ncbi:MAG TPA: NAAT family transporter [Burkholderiales bacterium]|jgi:multiple antibiotic resistance protein|nr:NAAT family transporter [Burkholderiales bacterium]
MNEWADLFKLTVALLAIVDPIAGIPVFISATATDNRAARGRTARLVALTVFCVLAVSALIGTEILRFFGISIPSFLISGGILLLMLAVSMLQAQESRIRQTPDEAVEAAEKDAVAVVPLGIPLLAGPGAISTMIIATHQSPGFAHHLALLIPAALIALAVWATLAAATRISERLGRTGMNIITRVMGLIIAAIAIEYIYRGLAELFPKLV